MPTLILTPRFTDDSQKLWRAAMAMGWRIERLRTWRVPEELTKIQDPILYVEALLAPTIAESFGIQLTEPPDNWLSSLPLHLSRRAIRLTSMEEARKLDKPYFVKPPNDKSFTAKVYNPGELPAYIGDWEKVLISDPMEFDREYRCFIADKRVCCYCLYMKDGVFIKEHEPDELDQEIGMDAFEFAQEVVYEVETPKAVVLDVGRTKTGKWAAIELNAVWGSGIYSCDPRQVLKVLHKCMKYSKL